MRVASVRVEPCGRQKCLVTIQVELADRKESMTFEVVVPLERDEGAVQECGLARAKDLARRFAELTSQDDPTMN